LGYYENRQKVSQASEKALLAEGQAEKVKEVVVDG